MKCKHCEKKAVMNSLCSEHFIENFEEKFWKTIERFSLVNEDEKIVVAASGGKDSLVTMHLLSQKYSVDALAVDEGIPGYRDKTLIDLEKFCKERKINLRIISFKDLGSKPLSEVNPERPCSYCGVLRRKALMKYSSNYDLLATGHNLDDEAQTVVMNLLRNQPQLNARLGPRTEGKPARIKPLYLTSEKEVAAYAFLTKIRTEFVECPNTDTSFRFKVGEMLNKLEQEQPNSKINIVEHFLKQTFVDETPKTICIKCGGPSSHKLCKACNLVSQAAL